jgi:hypothetical protein
MPRFVLWFPRRRAYLYANGGTGPLLDEAKVFDVEWVAHDTARDFSYPSADGQIPEPFSVDRVGLRLLHGDT